MSLTKSEFSKLKPRIASLYMDYATEGSSMKEALLKLIDIVDDLILALEPEENFRI